MNETLFVSDIHLDSQRQPIIDLFNSFLVHRAVHADALYILGDLFEYWIGDDAPYSEYAATFEALKQVTQKEVPVFFLHGNRDFLIAREFAEMTGITLLNEEHIIHVYEQKLLLMHGDTLCTDDIAYQNFRKKTHNRWLQKFVLQLPVSLRQRIANHLRSTSKQAVEQKPADIMDVNQDAVNQVMRKYQVTTLIHGHTHRPAIHHFDLGETPCTRVVLGDWYRHGNILCMTSSGMRMEDFSN